MEGMEALAGTITTKAISPSALYATIWVEYGICTVVMVLRGYSQFFVLCKFTADDFVMLGAYIIQGVASGLVTTSTYYGLGSSITSLNLAAIKNVLKYAMISQPFGVIAPLLGRISFMLFLLNSVITMKTMHNLRRKLLWCLIGLQIPINIIPCILQFTQCNPVDALWDPLQLMLKCQGARVVQKFGYFQGAFNALTDLILILIGLAVIISLKMRRSNKLVLCGILSLSLLAMIAAILKTVQIRLLNSTEFSHAMGLWAIWFLTEGTVVIITASVPRLRAIVVLGRQSRKSSYNYNYPYNNYNAYMPSASRNSPNGTEDRVLRNADKNQILLTTDLHIEREDMSIGHVRSHSHAQTLQRGRSVTSRCEAGIRNMDGSGNENENGNESGNESSSSSSNGATSVQGSLTRVQAAAMESGVELIPVAKERSPFL